MTHNASGTLCLPETAFCAIFRASRTRKDFMSRVQNYTFQNGCERQFSLNFITFNTSEGVSERLISFTNLCFQELLGATLLVK